MKLVMMLMAWIGLSYIVYGQIFTTEGYTNPFDSGFKKVGVRVQETGTLEEAE